MTTLCGGELENRAGGGAGSAEYQVQRRCRVCARICKSIYTHSTTKVGKELSHPRDLEAAFGIQVHHDRPDIHPSYFCNTCYFKMKQTLNKNTNTSLQVYDWQPHTDTGICVQCQHFIKEQVGGRPKSSSKNRGRPKTKQPNPLDQLQTSVSPSWNAPQPLLLSTFLVPSTGLQIGDV